MDPCPINFCKNVPYPTLGFLAHVHLLVGSMIKNILQPKDLRYYNRRINSYAMADTVINET